MKIARPLARRNAIVETKTFALLTARASLKTLSTKLLSQQLPVTQGPTLE